MHMTKTGNHMCIEVSLWSSLIFSLFIALLVKHVTDANNIKKEL